MNEQERNQANLSVFEQAYRVQKEKFEQAMKHYQDHILKRTYPPKIKELLPFFFSLNEGGKYIRAYLIALGSNGKNAIPLALSYELFQTSILIHDDIIDHASLRRGKPTIPVQYLNTLPKDSLVSKEEQKEVATSVALCLGDYGIYLASDMIVSAYADQPFLNTLLHYYHETVFKTIEGELLDVVLPLEEQLQTSKKTTEEDVFTIYRFKTARYTTVGPFLLGMMLNGNTEAEMDQMKSPLEKVGIAFQIKDDLLGIFGEEQVLGKSSCSDISEFKQTILYSYLLKQSPEMQERFFRVYGKKELLPEDMEEVKQILTDCGAKEYAEQRMNQLFLESEQEIREISFLEPHQKQQLLGFLIYLKKRNK